MQVRTDFPFTVTVIENLFIPLPDGTRLAAKLWRPEGAGHSACDPRIPALSQA